MSQSGTALLLVLKVAVDSKGCVIRAQDLRTGELREFTSWAEFRRYAEKEARTLLR